MTILVTGSSGHLGEALMRLLRERGEVALGLDLIPGDFTHLVGDITDGAVVHEAMASARAVLHTATLHKPHIATHTRQDFVDTNITGTLRLLEAAEATGVESFVFTSTTSAFGASLRPGPGDPAVWITERVRSVPKNIYGATKTAAEDLCELSHRQTQMPVVILRTSRFFPEDDDASEVRQTWSSQNAKVNELLYRRADIADMAQAHLCALDKAPRLGFDRFIISSTSPFEPEDLAELRADAPKVVERRVPDFVEVYRAQGWSMFPSIDRVYSNDKARRDLGWTPQFTFERALRDLAKGEPIGSALARAVGAKGYHGQPFEGDGPYPVR